MSEVGRVVEIGESKAQIFELRVVNAVWATLKVSRAGLVLEHHLNPVRIATCPGLMIYDGDGEPLSLRHGGAATRQPSGWSGASEAERR